jgi:hypothetical protein
MYAYIKKKVYFVSHIDLGTGDLALIVGLVNKLMYNVVMLPYPWEKSSKIPWILDQEPGSTDGTKLFFSPYGYMSCL